MASRHPDVAQEILDRLRLTCLDLPEAYEERAWVGTRWMVTKKNFAHVLMVAEGWPPAYASAAGINSGCVLTFRSPQPAHQVERFGRPPFFRPRWFPNIVGLSIGSGASTDWQDVAELVTLSYRVLAPKKLVALLDSP
jgi:hypothetical protein